MGLSRGEWERMNRADQPNPYRIFPLILGGVVFIAAGAIVLGRHDAVRASAWFVIGAGMVLYGLTEALLRNSRVRLPALLMVLAIWFLGVYWVIDAIIAPVK